MLENDKSAVRVLHMASVARSGETMLQGILSRHSKVRVAGQLTDSPEGERRIEFFKKWRPRVIPVDHPVIAGLHVPEGGVVLVKQGVWEHRWDFDGFVLARNPLSVYYSLKTYDAFAKRFTEHFLWHLGARRSAVRLKGSHWRLRRWMEGVDPVLVPALEKLGFLESFCAFYNRRMEALSQKGLYVVHYEKLVVDPVVEITKLCESIGVEFEPAMVATQSSSHRVRGHGKNDLSRPVSTASLDKSRRLSLREIRKVVGLTAVAWQNLGYQLNRDMLEPLHK